MTVFGGGGVDKEPLGPSDMRTSGLLLEGSSPVRVSPWSLKRVYEPEARNTPPPGREASRACLASLKVAGLGFGLGFSAADDAFFFESSRS